MCEEKYRQLKWMGGEKTTGALWWCLANGITSRSGRSKSCAHGLGCVMWRRWSLTCRRPTGIPRVATCNDAARLWNQAKICGYPSYHRPGKSRVLVSWREGRAQTTSPGFCSSCLLRPSIRLSSGADTKPLPLDAKSRAQRRLPAWIKLGLNT